MNADLTVTNFLGQPPTQFSYGQGRFDKAIYNDPANNFGLSMKNSNFDLVSGSDFVISFYLNKDIDIFLTYFASGLDLQIQISADLKNNSNKTDIALFSDYSSAGSGGGGSSSSSGNSGFEDERFSINSVEDGNFHHVIVQRDYSNQDARTVFYLDGAEVHNVTTSDKIMTGRTQVLNRLSLRTEEALDHVKFFHRSLSATEIQALIDE